jgi:hypothetical protein
MTADVQLAPRSPAGLMLEPPLPIADPIRRRRISLGVALILLISAALRLWQVATPAEYMFDEVYYAKDAKAIVDGRVGPKPPLRWEAGDEVSWPHPEMGSSPSPPASCSSATAPSAGASPASSPAS